MTDQERLKFDFDPVSYKGAKLAVIGVGGAGGNAVATMVARNVENVSHMICNTDIQALQRSPVQLQVQIGEELTRGLGAGGNPEVGCRAAEESIAAIEEEIKDVDMLFITGGMGGGTGTGAAPVIARKAMEMGILTVGVVTKPFRFEGPKREQLAARGLQELKESVNTLVVIPNQKLLEIEDMNIGMMDAFRLADEILVNAVRGISDLITTAGYVNVDFADVRTIMANMGMAIMGSATASGEDRALEAAQAAISSPLLDDLKINGAQGILVNVTGPSSLTLQEVDEAVGFIQESAHPAADFIFGYVVDENMQDEVKVTVIATGFPETNEDKPERRPRQRGIMENLDIPTVKRRENRERNETHSFTATTPPPIPEQLMNDSREVKISNSFNRIFEPDLDEQQIKIPSFRRRVDGKQNGGGNV